MNCYVVLGVPSDADAETIHGAFRLLARRYHPDAGAGSSPEKFRQVVEAYETLSDPTRRQAHDEALRPVKRPTMVPVEPMVRQPGHTVHPSFYGSHSWFTPDLGELFNELFRSLQDDVFFGPSLRGW